MKLIIDVPGVNAAELTEIERAVNKTITWGTMSGPAITVMSSRAPITTFRSASIASVKTYIETVTPSQSVSSSITAKGTTRTVRPW